MLKAKYLIVLIGLFITLIGCGDMTPVDTGDLSDIPFETTPFEFDLPDHFPPMSIPADNPMTEEGIELGRHLFYDKILSDDNSMACASCHLQQGNFTDNQAVSLGIAGIAGKRSSMSLLNIGFNTNGLFWDGRTMTLEEQALLPVEDPIELHTTWPEVETKLRDHDTYPTMFRQAFGISNKSEITKTLATKALAQFERSIVSSGQSKYDRVISGEEVFTDEELRGHNIFFDVEPDMTQHAECGHCHNAPLFTTNEFANNGIDDIDGGNLIDLGREEVTGVAFDKGVFRIPSLRNIESSGPFMHDGRFNSLDETIDHYVTGGKRARNLDPVLHPLFLPAENRAALKAFIKTLEDPIFMADKRYASPF